MEEVASNSQLHCSKNMGGRGADAITGNQGLGHCESRGNSITLRTGLRVARVTLCLATRPPRSIYPFPFEPRRSPRYVAVETSAYFTKTCRFHRYALARRAIPPPPSLIEFHSIRFPIGTRSRFLHITFFVYRGNSSLAVIPSVITLLLTVSIPFESPSGSATLFLRNFSRCIRLSICKIIF